ncbi:hypothetical protein VM98_38915, partial [Streptomyces rubellomurinus subsp. indigoferus]
LPNRLNTAAGLRMPTSLLFDHPTPAAVVRHIREHPSGPDPARPAHHPAPPPPDPPAPHPLAVAGLACRLPPGVNSPDHLSRLVSAARGATTRFPDARRWRV